MPHEVEDIFTAKAKSVFQILTETGTGYYIPPYQRPYSWEVSNVDRLFDDLVRGISILLTDENSFCFLGTMVVMKDTTYQTIEPHHRDHLPSNVLLLIDGQQRITTLVLTCISLHSYIGEAISKLDSISSEHLRGWLKNKLSQLQGRLEYTYHEDQRHGDGCLRYYPKVIRSYDDSWSSQKSYAKYDSSIARFLIDYIFESQGESYETENKAHDQELLNKNFKKINQLIRSFCKQEGEDPTPPESFINSNYFNSFISLSDEVKRDLLLANRPDSLEIELFHLIIFGEYFLQRLALTKVVAKNEDYAFDLFESLNTTGEPLTAIETFKPLVVKEEGYGEYEQSISKQYLDTIDNLFTDVKTAADKQKHTNNLLIPFRLSESGDKLTKHLSEQRKYLRNDFLRLDSIVLKRDFLKYMSYMARFLINVWPEDSKKESKFEIEGFSPSEDLLMCLEILRDAKHSITQAILFRYYCQLLDSQKTTNDLDFDVCAREFENATRAIVAFFWALERVQTKYR